MTLAGIVLRRRCEDRPARHTAAKVPNMLPSDKMSRSPIAFKQSPAALPVIALENLDGAGDIVAGIGRLADKRQPNRSPRHPAQLESAAQRRYSG